MRPHTCEYIKIDLHCRVRIFKYIFLINFYNLNLILKFI